MAKAKTLAALAGLAGLAYAMRNKDDKDKGMTPGQNDDLATANRVKKMSDDSDTLARVNRNMSAGQSAADDTNAGVLKALATPKTAPNDQAGNQGVLSPKSITPEVKPKNRGMTSKQHDMLATANRNRLTDEKIGRGRRMASGGMTSSASSRADGIATKGKTRGKIC